jgi:hypothetical protein
MEINGAQRTKKGKYLQLQTIEEQLAKTGEVLPKMKALMISLGSFMIKVLTPLLEAPLEI